MEETDFEGKDGLELLTRLAFCAPLAAVAGYASPELEANLGRIERLTADLEDSVAMFPAILGCGRFISSARTSNEPAGPSNG